MKALRDMERDTLLKEGLRRMVPSRTGGGWETMGTRQESLGHGAMMLAKGRGP